MTTAKKYLTTPEMCERYGVSRWTIVRWEKDGTIPPAIRNRGKHPRWWLPMVEDFERQQVQLVDSQLPGNRNGVRNAATQRTEAVRA